MVRINYKTSPEKCDDEEQKLLKMQNQQIIIKYVCMDNYNLYSR